MMPPELQVAHLDWIRERYRPVLHAPGGPRLEELPITLALHVASGSTILELGCGGGQVMDIVREVTQPSRLAGIDIIPEAYPLASKYGEFFLGDYHTLPFKDKEFEWVLALSSLRYSYDALVALREAKRVASQGILIEDGNLGEPAARRPEAWIDALCDGAWFLTSFRYTVLPHWHGVFKRQEMERA